MFFFCKTDVVQMLNFECLVEFMYLAYAKQKQNSHFVFHLNLMWVHIFWVHRKSLAVAFDCSNCNNFKQRNRVISVNVHQRLLASIYALNLCVYVCKSTYEFYMTCAFTKCSFVHILDHRKNCKAHCNAHTLLHHCFI